MKLNYTQRTTLEIGAYSFITTMVLFGGLWLVFELYLDSWGDNDIQEITTTLEQVMSGGEGSAFNIENLELYIPPAPIPDQLQQIRALGITPLKDGRKVYSSIHPGTGKRYYIVINQRTAKKIEPDEWIDIVVIAMGVLVTALITMLLTWRMTKRLVSPVLHLKQQMEQVTDRSHQIPVIGRDDEIGELSRSLQDTVERMHGFIARERDFTRFASHELRSPVTIMQGNLELIAELVPDTPLSQRALNRMTTATQRMNMIIDSFLWLAREQSDTNTDSSERIDATALTSLLTELEQGFASNDWLRFHVTQTTFRVRAHRTMLLLLIDNLLRNALRHCNQPICIDFHDTTLVIENPADDSENTQGNGFGLQIIQRICEKNHWTLNIQRNTQQFRVEIDLGPSSH